MIRESPFEKNCQCANHTVAHWLYDDAVWRVRNRREFLDPAVEEERQFNAEIAARHGLVVDSYYRRTQILMKTAAFARVDQVRLQEKKAWMWRLGITEIPKEIADRAMAEAQATHPDPPRSVAPEPTPLPKDLVEDYFATQEKYYAACKVDDAAHRKFVKRLLAELKQKEETLAGIAGLTEELARRRSVPEKPKPVEAPVKPEPRPTVNVESKTRAEVVEMLRAAGLSLELEHRPVQRQRLVDELNALDAALRSMDARSKKPVQTELFGGP